MTEPPRRKRFQFHLSTAIVMMFVAGGLMWANASPVDSVPIYHRYPGAVDYGWPQTAVCIDRLLVDQQWFERVQWGIVTDIAVACALLFSVWFFCEWLIRRRAARKGA